MSDSGKGFETFITIIGVILLLLFIFGDDSTKIGVIYAPMGIGFVLVIYFALKNKIKQDRKERIYQRENLVKKNYPDAYRAYIIGHILNDKKWTDDERKGFMKVSDAQWSTWQKEEDDRREAIRTKKKRILSEVIHLENEAPKGLKYWLEKNNKEAKWVGINIDGVSYEIEKDIKNVLNHSEEIVKLELFCNKKEKEKTWSKEQETFSLSVRKLADGPLKGLGCFKYSVPIFLPNEDGKVSESSQRICQLFFHSYCTNVDLDYSLLPSKVELLNYLLNIQSTTDWKPYASRLYRQVIIRAITALREKYEDLAVVIYNDEHIEQFFDELLDGVQPSLMRNQDNLFAQIMISLSEHLEEEKIPVYKYSEISQDFSVLQNKKVFVITNQTATSEIISFSRQLWDRYFESRPCISFLSLFKEHSTEEMQRLIDKKKNAIKEEEERKQREKELIESIPSKVITWEIIPSANLRIKYLLDYYPTTVDFEADDTEWDDRWTVWYFKNDPEKTPKEAHKRVLDRIIHQFVDILKNTFGEDALKFLTLVCIPASTKEKNDSRYNEFSERLCQETGIENAFPFVQVISEKMPKREGGEEGVVNYSFDDSFFNGKRVILLDDIITKGNSMYIAKAMLEKLGAKVICGLAVGKTRHERRESCPVMDEDL